MASLHKLVINSADRHSSSASSTDFLIHFPSVIPNVKHFCLHSAIIPNSIYNIKSGINDSVSFFEDSTEKQATLTPGQYNANRLCTELAAQLTATSNGYATYSASYSSTTQRISVSSTQNFQLLFSTGVNAATSCYRELGFLSSAGLAGIDTTLGTSVTGSSAPNLGLPYNLFVQIKYLENPVWTSNSCNQKFTYVMNLSESGPDIIYQNINVTYDNVSQNYIQAVTDLEIRLVDASNRVVDLAGLDWVMILECKK